MGLCGVLFWINKYLWSYIFVRLKATFGIMLLFCSWMLGQNGANGGSSAEESGVEAVEDVGVPVEIDGRPILIVYASIGGVTPQERAQAIQERIIGLARTKSIAPEAVHMEDRGAWTEIVADKDRIMGITEADAKLAERKRSELAAEYTEIIRQVVLQYRLDHTWKKFVLGSSYAALATLGVVAILVGIVRIRRRTRPKVDRWLQGFEAKSSARSPKMRLQRYAATAFVVIGRIFYWILILGLIQVYGTLVLRFFPATKYISYQITSWLLAELANLKEIAISYIPQLVLILVICVVTSYLLKLNTYIFTEIRDEKLTIRGFYPDWAEPTAQLVKVFIIAAAAIVVFPYLPGSGTPAFKGISVFLGVLISLGSTSAVAHGVAGTILTYMRAFKIGDFVRIGNETGEVVEKTLLVTRICTQKREVVTIPNGTILGGAIVNYSAEGRHEGVIFHTTVTIGYSAPWRQVHELLLCAALETDDILRKPPPFVLQTALNDFYVAYELNAYTAKPMKMQHIYSVLHQNIQDRFNEAGIELNSPHYRSFRDGNQTTIPKNYLARNAAFNQSSTQPHSSKPGKF